MEDKLNSMIQKLRTFSETFSKTTADTLSWLGIVILHLATVPSFLAIMSGLSEKMPPLDIILLLWMALLIFFLRSAILKDMLMVVTIGVGFAIQAIMLGIIFFV